MKSSKIIEAQNIKKEEKDKYIAPKLNANTLFSFSRKLEYIIDYLKKKTLPARYVVEDISYLKIPNFDKIAFPMKCFCDINFHQLEEHLNWYGSYGIAFSKQWGMEQGIQPLQYINVNSCLRKDFSEAFMCAKKIDPDNQSNEVTALKGFLIHQLMFYKPYSGKNKNANGEEKEKCFTDECEWRFVPDVSQLEFSQIIYDKSIMGDDTLNILSNALGISPEASLRFEYDDIKYIIIKTQDDFKEFIKELNKIIPSNDDRMNIVSKIIIWEKSEGDF